ncbi:MFS general substrate transporter [Clavulina sp. PMI_390]|nr:MFS general substrate transporter [Clavulina sp. PMI_390]
MSETQATRPASSGSSITAPANLEASSSKTGAGNATNVVPARVMPSNARRYAMLAIFCFGEFMDAFSASCLVPAIASISGALHLQPTEVSWIFSAYSATFAAFLLISGRVSDIYSSRVCFILGAFLIGAFSLGGGFTHSKVGFFILRAFAGIGAALNVPSALSLIVEWFPDPAEQAMAIAMYGAGGGIGNVVGVIVGGLFVQYTTWRWILWFIGIVCMASAIAAVIVVPPSAPREHKPSFARLDIGGISLMTAAIVLFVYALTEGPAVGWSNARCLAPLIISIFLAGTFFIYEARIPEKMAALPPRVWHYQNVPMLFAVAFVPFWWWATVSLNTIPHWISVYGWSPVISSVHFLPNGIVAILCAGAVGPLSKVWPPKYVITMGLCLVIVGSLLLPFGDRRERYWSLDFPAFLIGSSGCMLVFTNANVAIFMNTPPAMAGVTGAIFNAALQLAVALGVAINTSIVDSVNNKRTSKGEEVGFNGIAAGYWFNVAFVAIMLAGVIAFYKKERPEVLAEIAQNNEKLAGLEGDEEETIGEKPVRDTAALEDEKPAAEEKPSPEGDLTRTATRS